MNRDFLALALALAALSFTATKSTMPLVVPLRRWLSERAVWLSELLHCPICASHWIALPLLAVYRPRIIHSQYVVLDYFVTWQALVAAAMAPIFVLYFIARVE